MFILAAMILFVCIFAEKFSDRVGMPALMTFMFIGILFGVDGLFKLSFESFEMAERVCSTALTFIMFYGGFNTKWTVAKAYAVKSISLSTIGVVITAGIVTFMCHLVLHISLLESFLIGAVLSCTDAASVFAILRKKKLNLRNGMASVLEVESGSNDPMAYLLTIIAIALVNGNGYSEIEIVKIVLLQIIIGIVLGFALAEISIFVLTKTKAVSEGLDTIFLISMVLLCYGSSVLLDGNEYLAVYILGIVVGNSKISHKNTLIPFFDGVTSLAQIVIFFLIGLLTIPHMMIDTIGVAVGIAVLITFVARPIAIFVLMLPMKYSFKECLLLSWAGLRGASSSVFAIHAVAAGVAMKQDLFHIVFIVSLLSVLVQGTLLPSIARGLKLVDNNQDVRKTFNDYQEETSLQLMRMHIARGHEWENKMIKDVNLPTGSLALMIKRGKETIITKGNTIIKAGDNLILNIPPYTTNAQEHLKEKYITKDHKWCGKTIGRLKLAKNVLIAMVIRGEETIIPDGKTIILDGDIVVMYKEGKDPIEGVL
ncbi:MAG: potassium/proton antiporter [Lachnospiraceae bacterium]|nr:potassium/proton antiporter [Lachnospiraceae bacterium]